MSATRRLSAGIAVVVLVVAVVLSAGAVRIGWAALWGTPDQRGAWALRRGAFEHAASLFADPVWRGVALMRAGRFKDAAESFGDVDTAVAAYDRGNALVMLGQYTDAVAQYDQALKRLPGWADAQANRELALARAALVAHQPGEEAANEKGADEMYRRERSRDATPGNETAAMTDASIRALWLRRVQTRPADFLRARFAYQLQEQRH